MEDWLRQFKDNLQNRPEPDFDERNWQALQQRLDRRNGRRFAAAWWWLALPALLLLLVSNTWFFLENRQSDEKLAVLGERLETVLAQRPDSYRDTVYVKQVIYQTDTIYLTRIVQQYLPSYAFAENSGGGNARAQAAPEAETKGKNAFAKANSGTSMSASLDSSATAESNVGRVLNPADVVPNPIAEENKTAENQPVELSSERIEDPQLALFPRRKISLSPTLLPSVQPLEKKKTLAQVIHQMRPKHLRLGVSAGWVAPANAEVKNEGGTSASLETQVVFSPRFCLWAEASYFDVLYSSSVLGGETGIPVVESPTPDFIFIEAEAPQKYFLYAAGVQYFFNSKGKLKPFLGAGLGAVSLFTYDVSYDFRNGNGIEVTLEEEISHRELLTGRLSLRLGLEHEFHKNWSWLARGTYHYQWKDKGLLSQNGLGIQVGLVRRF